MLNIEKNVQDGVLNLGVSGRLDTQTCVELQRELEPVWEAGELNIVMDLADLQYVSSAGLRVFLMSEKKCRANDKSMTLTNVSQTIREIFDIVGFSGILTID